MVTPVFLVLQESYYVHVSTEPEDTVDIKMPKYVKLCITGRREETYLSNDVQEVWRQGS